MIQHFLNYFPFFQFCLWLFGCILCMGSSTVRYVYAIQQENEHVFAEKVCRTEVMVWNLKIILFLYF